MKDTSFETLKNNIIEDINKCSNKELKKIYDAIRKALKEFDKDSFLKNCKDFFNNILKSKQQKCILFINDIVDSRDKLTAEEKEKLRIAFLDISNIHRTFIENLIALIGAL